MIEESKVSLDTTTILRGSLLPRGSRNPQALRYQLRLHRIAKSILDDIFSGKLLAYIASPVLVEVSVVGARLTGNETLGRNISDKVRDGCIVINDSTWLEPSMEIGARIKKCSGFDCVIYTCAVITQTPLITNDQGLNGVCKEQGYKTYFLREMV